MAQQKDSLGERMKKQYEDRTRYYLPRRTYTIVRLDGKSFHTFTRDCEKPFDDSLADALDAACIALCEEAMGVQFAYLQSDEMSLLLTDFAQISTEAWFDGNIQKICSVSASIVTVKFNAMFGRMNNYGDDAAFFDARVFTIPDPTEVENYFIWRQKDCIRNSIQMVAQSLYSQKQLHGKNTADMQDMIHEKGQNWNDCPQKHKNGRLIIKRVYRTGIGADRTKWDSEPAYTFTQERERLNLMIPSLEDYK